MLHEETIEFLNKESMILRGILHHADNMNKKGISLISLNTGLNDMAGWHRLQVKNARYFASQGYNVLRFNDTGIGNSEGEILDKSIVKIFSDIETGLFVENANCAAGFIRAKFPDDKIIFIGYCGGGLTAMHASAYNNNVAGVIDIAGPITLSSEAYLEKTDPWEVQKNIKKYKMKFFKLDPWIRLMTGRGDYKTIFNSILYYIKHALRGEYRDDVLVENVIDIKNLNIKVFRSFEMFVKSSRPLLFYFAEFDSATWEFKKYFLQRYQSSKIWNTSKITYLEVPKANHIFSSDEAQENMKTDISRWLESHFSQ